MFQVGDKVTRKGSKVWEIATVAKAGDVFDSQLAILGPGGPDAIVYQLKDPATGKVAKNVRWSESDLTAV